MPAPASTALIVLLAAQYMKASEASTSPSSYEIAGIHRLKDLSYSCFDTSMNLSRLIPKITKPTLYS
ncbi:MAG: hypothetical protein ACO2O0_06175 [Desulfurococcales archaeon]